MKNQIIGQFILAILVIFPVSSCKIGKTSQAQVIKPVITITKPDLPVKVEGSTPRGIFMIQGAGKNWAKLPREGDWEDPCIDGLVVRMYWKDLERNPDRDGNHVYDWTKLEEQFKKAKENHKLIHLMIPAGFYSPQWVLERVETHRFIVPRGEDMGEMKPLPLPWDDTYLTLWFQFVDALAKEFGDRPELSLISVTGPNSHNGEVNLPRKPSDKDIKGGHPNYDPIQRWEKIVGGANPQMELARRVLDAYKETIDRFEKAFPTKHFSLQIFDQSLPVKDETIQDWFQNSLIKYACRCDLEDPDKPKGSEPRKAFVLMNGGLDAWPWVGIISDKFPLNKPKGKGGPEHWRRIQYLSDIGLITGFQARAPLANSGKSADDLDIDRGSPTSRLLYRQILRNGIRFGASFLEIYKPNLTPDANLRDLTHAGSVLLNGKCQCGNISLSN